MNLSSWRQNHHTTTFVRPRLRRLTFVLVSLMFVTSMTVGCNAETFSAPTEFSQGGSQKRLQNEGGQKRLEADLSSPSIPRMVEVAEPAVVGVLVGALNDKGARAGTGRKGDSFYRVGAAMLFHKDSHYGYFVTNRGLVYPSAHVEVVLQSGRHVRANLAGMDKETDVAVLTVPVNGVANTPVIPFADSNSLQVGEPAVAIGIGMNGDFAQSVTSGIISSTSRKMSVSVIQTDAALNPGNSGGPLLNFRGEVVGMNVGKIQKPGFEGMGFAIPSNAVRKAAEKILQRNRAGH